MKHCIWIMICSLIISAHGAAKENTETTIAKLPEGISIELLGIRYFDARYLEEFKKQDYPWWRPNGLSLTEIPDGSRTRGAGGDTHFFVIRIIGDADCDCKAIGTWNSYLTVRSVRNKGQGYENDDLRCFTLRFNETQKQTDIQLGLAVGQWNVVENWPFWDNATPDSSFFGSSDGVIMRCPEQKGSDVVAEITQTILGDATRLVAFDKEGTLHESQKSSGSTGADLVSYIHRFKNLDIKKIDHLEFQARPYDYWITFSNVSLQMGQKTQVLVEIKKPGYLLPGQLLPNFDGIKIDPARIPTDNKSLLVCFFDMEQRPSRSCVLELSRTARKLSTKDIAIVAVQALKIEQANLDEWVKENNIPFPVGIIEGEIEKLKFNWGVKSFPWLILTDKKLTVIADGFSINRLEDKLKEITDVE
ncbi:MAG: hypothetical protein JW715_05555 [Sedimentisphaerales bacterium]|nr:hypothetical protein [Sedimentisphaerales bacterium]